MTTIVREPRDDGPPVWDAPPPEDEHPNAEFERQYPRDDDASAARFLDDAALEQRPLPEFLVADMIPAQGLSCVFAPPASGKSFFALGLALAVATGLPFLGRTVQRGGVIFVASEGTAGLGARIAAWKHAHEHRGAAGVQFYLDALRLLERPSVDAFIDGVLQLPVRPTLITVDTLSDALAGQDENSAETMSGAVMALRVIRRETGAGIQLVHHTGKSGEFERGSGVLRASMDVMVRLKREGAGRWVTATCDKARDFAGFADIPLELSPTRDSCVLTYCQDGVGSTRRFLADPAREALRVLHESALAGEGLSCSAWMKACEMKERTFYRARSALLALGYVDHDRLGPRSTYQVSEKGRGELTANCQLTAI